MNARRTFFGLLPGDAARRIALAWAVAVLLLLALAGRGAGMGAAESKLFDAARRHGAWWTQLVKAPLGSLREAGVALGEERGAAPLPLAAAGVGHALLRDATPRGELLAFRFAALLLASFLAYLLSRFGGELAGTAGALLAPAFFFLVPAAADASLRVGTAVPAAALWTGVLLACFRGLRSRDRRERIRRAAVAGILFGAAVATRRDAWALLPLVTFHYLAVRAAGGLRQLTSGEEPLHHPANRSAWRSLLAGLPYGIPAMLVLGPLVFAALTPWTWADPLHRLLPAAAASLPAEPFVHLGRVVVGTRPPWSAPILAAILLPPAAFGIMLLASLVHAGRRLLLGYRREAAASFSEELLLLLGALTPLLMAVTGVAPAEAGIGPVLPGLAIAAVLGARAVATAARTAWPEGAAKLTAALVLLAFYPALRATLHTFPYGADGWSEWIGGAPGAASLGVARGAPGATAELFAQLSERAAEGQRVWIDGLSPAAGEALRHDGRLRADLRIAPTAAAADIAVIPIDDARRDDEYEVWSTFGSARPVASARLDEVPLANVYARPGAWR